MSESFRPNIPTSHDWEWAVSNGYDEHATELQKTLSESDNSTNLQVPTACSEFSSRYELDENPELIEQLGAIGASSVKKPVSRVVVDFNGRPEHTVWCAGMAQGNPIMWDQKGSYYDF